MQSGLVVSAFKHVLVQQDRMHAHTYDGMPTVHRPLHNSHDAARPSIAGGQDTINPKAPQREAHFPHGDKGAKFLQAG